MSKGFSDLRTDQLPLPSSEEVLQNLELSRHALQRFRQRTESDWSLYPQALWRIRQQVRLSRRSPDWRIEEDVQFAPDLYLTFPFPWTSGAEDEGCLLLQQSQKRLFRKEHTVWVAVTFLSRLYDQGEKVTLLPPPPKKIVTEIAQIEKIPVDAARQKIKDLRPVPDPPPWLHQKADAWLLGRAWAISLQRQKLGPRHSYHYSWGKLYSRQKLRKEVSRRRYNRLQQKRGSGT